MWTVNSFTPVAAFDVALAADFSSPGPPAIRAEVRALFFLASWIENVPGRVRDACPLHLACVGAAVPESVAALAARAGARVSAHEPWLIPTVVGKRPLHRLRALETGPFATGRVLLLDAGELVAAEPFTRLAALPGDVIASSPADRPPLPGAVWPSLYRAVGLEPPAARMRSLRAELELSPRDGAPDFEGQGAEAAAMFPCYDPGVLLLPLRAAAALRELWPDHLARVAAALVGDPALPEAQRRKLAGKPYLSLATAHAALLATGAAAGWRRLPRGCDARLSHFQGGAMRSTDVRLLDAMPFFRDLVDPSQLQVRLRAAGVLWRSYLTEGRQRNTAGPVDPGLMGVDLSSRWRRWWARREGRHAEARLWRLYHRHVRPALRATGAWG